VLAASIIRAIALAIALIMEAARTSETSVSSTIVDLLTHSYGLEYLQENAFPSGKINYGLYQMYTPISEICMMLFTIRGHVLGQKLPFWDKTQVSCRSYRSQYIV
jgi:hypothetical protein